MGVMYVLAGINHFIVPDLYMKIMPPYLPYHRELVEISGICEMICGILLLLKPTRRLGAWLTVALLIAVFPANIQMAIDFYKQNNPYLPVAILRLPLQFILIAWAYSYTKEKSPV